MFTLFDSQANTHSYLNSSVPAESDLFPPEPDLSFSVCLSICSYSAEDYWTGLSVFVESRTAESCTPFQKKTPQAAALHAVEDVVPSAASSLSHDHSAK